MISFHALIEVFFDSNDREKISVILFQNNFESITFDPTLKILKSASCIKLKANSYDEINRLLFITKISLNALFRRLKKEGLITCYRIIIPEKVTKIIDIFVFPKSASGM